MSPRKRRGPVVGNRPSCALNSTATTTLDGPSLSLSSAWIPYQEDQFGDVCEPPGTDPVRVTREATPDCGCVLAA
jgi:hypothetical protein